MQSDRRPEADEVRSSAAARLSRLCAVVVTAVALPVTAVGPAGATAVAAAPTAAESEDLVVQVVVPDRTAPGALVLSIAGHGDAVQFGNDQRVGDRLSFDAQLPEVRVTDTRTVTQTNDGGWSLTGRSSTFVSDAAEFGADHLGWTPRIETVRDGLAAGPGVLGVLRGGAGLAGPATLASANDTGRLDTARVTADLSLEIPVGTPAGGYSAALSISLFPTD